MPTNRTVTFQRGVSRTVAQYESGTGMSHPAFLQGTVGINILIVSQLPAVGDSKYIYAVPGVNEVIDGIPVIRMYIYFNNQWYALTDSRYINVNGTAEQTAHTAETEYWNLMNQIAVAREVLNKLIDEEADQEDIDAAQDTLDGLEAQKETKFNAWTSAKSAATAARAAGVAALNESRANIVDSEG